MSMYNEDTQFNAMNKRIARLEAENAKLKEQLAEVKSLAQAVVEDDKRGPAPQIQQHLIDALAALLGGE